MAFDTIDPNRISLAKALAGNDPYSGLQRADTLERSAQIRQIDAENARRIAEYEKQVRERAEQLKQKDEEQRRAREAAQAAAMRKNLFFGPKGWEFIVTPTYDDPFGQRPVSRADINPDYLKQNPNSQLAQDLKKAEDKAINDYIFNTYKQVVADLAAKGQRLDSPLGININHDTGQVTISGKVTDASKSINQANMERYLAQQLGGNYAEQARQQVPLPELKPNETKITLADGTVVIGDKKAINQVRQEAYQQLVHKQLLTGKGSVDNESIDRRTVALLQTKYKNGVPIKTAPPESLSDFGYLAPVKGNPFAFVESDEFGNKRATTIVSGPYAPVANRENAKVLAGKEPFSEPDKGIAGFTAGFYNAFENTVKSFTSIPEKITTGKDPAFKPEAEGQFFGAVVDTVKDAVQYGAFSATTAQNANSRFANLAKDIVTHGDYYAGSIAASALMWLTPAVAVKGAKALVETIKLSGIEKNFVKPLQAAVKEDKSVVSLEKDTGLINVGRESDPYRYGIGRVTTVPLFEKVFNIGGKTLTVSSKSIRLGKSAVEFFTKTPIEDMKFIVSNPSRTAGYVSKVVNLESGLFPVKLLKAGGTRGSITVTKNLDVFEKTEVIAEKEPVFLKVPKQDKVVATSETFTGKEFRDLLASDSGLSKILGKEPTGLRITKADRGNKPMSPFTAAVEQVHKSETQVTKQFLKDTGIIENAEKKGSAGPSIINPLVGLEKGAENAIKALGLGGNAKDYSNKTLLGLGGATGAERKKAKEQTITESVFDIIAYPSGKQSPVGPKSKDVSSLMSHTSIISDLEQRQNIDKIFGLGGQKSIVDEFSKYADSIIPKVGTKAATSSGVKNNINIDFSLNPKFAQDMIVKHTTKHTTLQKTAHVDIFNNVPNNRRHKFDLPSFRGIKLLEQKKKRGTKRVNRKFKITDIVFGGLFDPVGE